MRDCHRPIPGQRIRPSRLLELLDQYGPPGEGVLLDDVDLLARLSDFGRLSSQLSPVEREVGKQHWVEYLKDLASIPEPWRVVSVAMRNGGAGTVAPEAKRWLEDTELDQLPDSEDLVAGHIPEASTCVIYGPPGSGKTFVALDIALCVGTGQPWFSNEVRQGRVAYIAGEGRRGLKKRVRAWKSAYLDPDEAAHVSFLPEPVEFLQPQGLEQLLNDLRVWDDPPKLVVVDTLAQCLVGGDENSAADMGAFVHAVNRLRQEFDCTVIIVHHTGWDASKHERGHSALRGAADTTIRVEHEGGEITVTCEKQKEAVPFDRLQLKLRPEEGSCVLTRAVHDPEKLTAIERATLEALVDVVIDNEEGAGWTAWKTAATEVPKGRGTERVFGSQTSFHRAVKSLIGNGYVEKRAKRYHVTSKGYGSSKVPR